MVFISERDRARVLARLKAISSSSVMAVSPMTATSSLAWPVTRAALGAKPGSAAHCAADLYSKRWISSLASRSRAMCSTVFSESSWPGAARSKYCTLV